MVRQWFTLSLIFFGMLSAMASQSTYISGEQICELNKDHRKGEIGISIEVPVDYELPDGPKSQIYAWTLKPFDSNLKSMIYFVGGPGGSAHEFKFDGLENWNVIYMDERGIACSRPATEEIFNNPRFYSSEWIAKDADQLRKKLGIQKWSVYGQSYGTVPANISASLFPEATEALVLEGVVFIGDETLWDAPHRMKWLQKFYEHLPQNLKDAVKTLSESQQGNTYFSQVAMGVMYSDSPTETLTRYLQNYADQLSATSKTAIIANPSLFDVNSSLTPNPQEVLSLLYNEPNSFKMITCRELSAMNINSNFYYTFKDGKFSAISDSESLNMRISECKSAGIELNGPLVKMYQAVDYPVKVPVTYFQGTTDGATQAPQGVHHYKNVPQGFAQLLLKKNGGHAPSLSLISSLADVAETITDVNKLQQSIFEESLLGQPIDKKLIQDFNSKSDFDWVTTKRGL